MKRNSHKPMQILRPYVDLTNLPMENLKECCVKIKPIFWENVQLSTVVINLLPSKIALGTKNKTSKQIGQRKRKKITVQFSKGSKIINDLKGARGKRNNNPKKCKYSQLLKRLFANNPPPATPQSFSFSTLTTLPVQNFVLFAQQKINFFEQLGLKTVISIKQ